MPRVGVKHPHKGSHTKRPRPKGLKHPHKGSHVKHHVAKGGHHPHKGHVTGSTNGQWSQ